MREPIPLICVLFLKFFFFSVSSAIDTLTPSQPLSYGETLISANGTFALGFFTPPDTTNHYIGIWFHNLTVHTVVWVANSRSPIPNLNAALSITPYDSSLHLTTSGNSTPLWSSPSFPNSIRNPIAKLLDTGNFVVKASDSSSILWQSFDHPSDTMLSGMKIGRNLKTGIDRNITAWLSLSDPSPGKYAFAIEPIGVPQLVIRDASGGWLWRGGPWNGYRFSGTRPNPFFYIALNQEFVQDFNSTPEEVYYSFNTVGGAISIVTMDQNGTARLHEWQDSSQKWNTYWSGPSDDCDFFPACGTNAICDASNSPMCRCLDGFDPRDPVSWGRGEWSDGCVRVTALGCGAKGTDEFTLVRGSKLPDTTEATADMNLGLVGCRERCSMNCSCLAYASVYPGNVENGCIIWLAEIRDLRFSGNDGQDFYVRIASPVKGIKIEKTKNFGKKQAQHRGATIPVSEHYKDPPSSKLSAAVLNYFSKFSRRPIRNARIPAPQCSFMLVPTPS